MNNIEQTLIDNFIHQKERLLERAGSRAKLNRARMNETLKPHMTKLALIVQDWDVDPGLLVEAAFAWARKNKHPDGPLPTMLCSVKYLSKALSHHLELPFEVVAEKRSSTVLMEKMDEEWARLTPGMRALGSDVHLGSSFPIHYRFAFAATKTINRYALKAMAHELLQVMDKDRKISMWMNSKGLKYETIANAFNEK